MNIILGALYKGRLTNGEGVVLKFRTFTDEGGWLGKFGRRSHGGAASANNFDQKQTFEIEVN